MANIDSVVTQTKTDLQGNTYTTNVSNDKLDNTDFMQLMLEEMKQQDPTDPMDSKELMDSTIQMSTIQANEDMSKGMAELTAAYKNSSLATASNMIGKVIEDGTMGDDGEPKRYAIETIESVDGTLYANSREITGKVDGIKSTDSGDVVKYDEQGWLYDADGNKLDYKVSLNSDGRFTFNDDGSIKLLDSDDAVVTDEDITSLYEYAGSAYTYAEETQQLPLDSITKVG